MRNPYLRSALGAPLTRRSALRGAAGLAAGGVLASPLLAACGDDSADTKSDAGSDAGPITFGSNYSDASTKDAFAALCQQAGGRTGVTITVNTSDHNTFQNNISNYLQGTPDSLATWFAGYRLQFFAAQGLLTPIDDVWEKIGGNFNDAAKNLSKGADGHYYLVPLYNYPWVVFYNKSVFSSKGYASPKTWDEFVALAQKMKTDGLVPLAFADKDGWPALGTFDILNLRINGYDYHMKLMKHEVPWTDKGVTDVFDKWRELSQYQQNGANGRTWQDAAKALENKQAGMMFQGSNQVAANYSPANLPDLDFFVFPSINPAHGTDYMDAPTDGFMLPKKGKNAAAAKKVLQYIGTPEAETSFLQTDHWDVGLANGLVAPTYNDIQKKSVAEIAKCKNVSQFMDRDTVPDMAAAMIKLIQQFIDSPTAATIATIQKSAEDQAKTIFSK
ncbi:ABC transporter substrate-binding protein [Dactylosporangium matsuzakiense]|uniref:ABC transporter substrate-binding protein n=1 Tax=Dactylosporangium matsuzakiense TaxID=53360 RepID=A0A9W6KVF6_9ACTN|nr:extracellular solute-binding protein [Dactylosporangium matsuzakiense]GLL08043.1 ABC transporter substrate-binding protein [Dactylosporangium matsuzakiense]